LRPSASAVIQNSVLSSHAPLVKDGLWYNNTLCFDYVLFGSLIDSLRSDLKVFLEQMSFIPDDELLETMANLVATKEIIEALEVKFLIIEKAQ
jgi:hypothetical protein